MGLTNDIKKENIFLIKVSFVMQNKLTARFVSIYKKS